ncbi:hypothetical protein ACFLXK_02355 [Chloroflexota bacterium]
MVYYVYSADIDPGAGNKLRKWIWVLAGQEIQPVIYYAGGASTDIERR